MIALTPINPSQKGLRLDVEELQLLLAKLDTVTSTSDANRAGYDSDRHPASYAVWFGKGDHRNSSGVVTVEPSNQAAELTAIWKALEILKGDP
jgi:hypothetical protein